MVSAGRVFKLIDEEAFEPQQANQPIKVTEGNIAFKNVSFSYDGKQKVLDNISFEVKKGETIAFVGATGSGKSSIINVFMRFYDFQSGHIRGIAPVYWVSFAGSLFISWDYRF